MMPAGGVPEQIDRLEPEVGAELLEVGGVVLGLVRLRGIRAVDSAGVEQDQPELLVEAREIVEDLDRDSGASADGRRGPGRRRAPGRRACDRPSS